MIVFPHRSALVACLLVSTASRPALASFHLWDVKEVFSNQDGTVQFIELFTTAGSEFLLENQTLTATSDGNVVNFTLNHDVAGSTANKHLLFATASFSALAGGVAPNYTPLPANFFNPNAASITINFAGVDSITFAGATLPKDGVHSLTDQTPAGVQNLASGINSPTNFAGAAGSVNVPPPTAAPADFNGDGSVNGLDLAAWKAGFGATGPAATKLAGNADGDSDVDGADYLLWQQGFNAAANVIASPVPEPASLLLAGVAASLLVVRRGRA